MLIGYARVSKADGSQVLDAQRDALIAAGVAPARIYEDLASARRDDRPGLKACLKALQPGNTLVVWKLDRLGRDLKHLVAVVDELRARSVGFRVLAGAEIDTTTANGRLVFGIFASLAEFERELIAERSRAGLAAARARGRAGGRPRKMDRAMLRIVMSAMADRETDVQALAQHLGVSRSLLYMYVMPNGTPTEAGKKILEQPVNPPAQRTRWFRRRVFVEGRGYCLALAWGDFAVIGGDLDGAEGDLRPDELVHLQSGAVICGRVAGGDLMGFAQALQTRFAWSIVTSPDALRNLLRADGPERAAHARELVADFKAGGEAWRQDLANPKFNFKSPSRWYEQATF